MIFETKTFILKTEKIVKCSRGNHKVLENSFSNLLGLESYTSHCPIHLNDKVFK